MRKTILWFLGVLIICLLLFLFLPFISFGKPLEEVCADAAELYGLSQDELSVEFKKTVVNSQGQKVQGLYTGYYEIEQGGQKVYNVQIKKDALRPVTIATIFHEFAHIAQEKYKLDIGDFTEEQHAEIFSFSMMWNNGYWWNALHLLPSHTFFAKSKEYRATNQLWEIVFTRGCKAVSLGIPHTEESPEETEESHPETEVSFSFLT